MVGIALHQKKTNLVVVPYIPELNWNERMTQRCSNILAFMLFSLVFAEWVQAGEALRPLRAESPPVLDGKLDDLVW